MSEDNSIQPLNVHSCRIRFIWYLMLSVMRWLCFHFFRRCCHDLCSLHRNQLYITLDVWNKAHLGLGKYIGWHFRGLDLRPLLEHWLTEIICLHDKLSTYRSITNGISRYILLIKLITMEALINAYRALSTEQLVRRNDQTYQHKTHFPCFHAAFCPNYVLFTRLIWRHKLQYRFL